MGNWILLNYRVLWKGENTGFAQEIFIEAAAVAGEVGVGIEDVDIIKGVDTVGVGTIDPDAITSSATGRKITTCNS